MIRDLFSHKIHSSGDEWPEKLAELAAIFGEFDGEIFDRRAFEQRLQRISPRVSYLTNGIPQQSSGRLDVSKFRDEISAYPAYLGLYFLEKSAAGWVVRVSSTAKRFLLCEEPDVGAFLRIQLPLFQYPNAMGAAYKSQTNKLRMQANAGNRTLEFIKNGVHLSPARLLSIAIKADATLRGVDVTESSVSYDEIFALANTASINQHALPPLESVLTTLEQIRLGIIKAPSNYESRFHILRHTEIFSFERRAVKLRETANDVDKSQLVRQLYAICSISNQFTAFDECKTSLDVESVIASGEWGQYFDGIKTLPSHVVDDLTNDKVMILEENRGVITVSTIAETYPFRDRNGSVIPIQPYSRKKELADPEVTKIKRQKRNLAHKELIDKMDSWLRRIGAKPKENDHIDLYAKIPSDGTFIFEMKSGGDSILEQIRKGLSQLYEYRYRYKEIIADEHISLCLVLPENPATIPWITEYLCNDREIALCWFEDDDNLVFPTQCASTMRVLLANNALESSVITH